MIEIIMPGYIFDFLCKNFGTMVIKEILTRLETSDHPVAKPLHKGENFKVLVIGFKSGMKLKDHPAHIPSRLTVISGKVIYKQLGKETELQKFDEIEIPVNTIHSVEAKEDSLCLLIQG
jgi:quercetin dioxygenase-like cupin family protein